MIAPQRLLGIVLITVPIAFMFGPWFRQFQRWLKAFNPVERGCLGYAIGTLCAVAVLAGLDLAFGYRPLGVDHHRPWTYFFAILPALAGDLVWRAFAWYLRRKQPYSAVSNDWLLWEQESTPRVRLS